jgi:ABC-2 type transport system ATP-binding protein
VKVEEVMALIEAKELTKQFRQAIKDPGLSGAFKHLFHARYKENVAVDHIDLSIEAGEAVAYLGKNGAGKSTTIKMLTGILIPSSGSVTIDGINPHKDRMENTKKIGAVFGQRTQLWWDIPIRESLYLMKDIYDIPEAIFKENLDKFSELLGLNEFMPLTARKLSLGQRMRADLAAALLHNPKIVYLDEPTIGLDITAKEKIRTFIKHINQEQNTTIMLTTHDLGDIENICKRLCIIDQGRIIYDGDLNVVKDTYAKNRTIHFQVETPIKSLESITQQLSAIKLNDDQGTQFSVSFDRFAITAGEVVGHIMKYGKVLDINIDEPNIEQVIKKVYEGDIELVQSGKAV